MRICDFLACGLCDAWIRARDSFDVIDWRFLMASSMIFVYPLSIFLIVQTWLLLVRVVSIISHGG
jgi:hypothetical protein